ncbi:hypothetical protein M514_00860 [Trichuris suis]|uniref:Uncharacterized protein n=1 Tax=Trichuris suis TaxID=68888 RepID=A0A085MVE1_9BILA|nr:hypothetical protein M513_00860 [Trichuris suis]KFD61187.1 hypothetical protein M514_00860 [Trichuris suis]
MDIGDAFDLGGCNHGMPARMASNASSEATNRFLHVNSQTCDGSALRRLVSRLTCTHSDSKNCVCSPVARSTKFTQWFTRKCVYASRLRHRWARHASAITVAPGQTCFCMTVSRVRDHRFSMSTKGIASFPACTSEDPLPWVPHASVVLAPEEQGLVKLHSPRRPLNLHRRFSQCFGYNLPQMLVPADCDALIYS